jgi:hypothetical protein
MHVFSSLIVIIHLMVFSLLGAFWFLHFWFCIVRLFSMQSYRKAVVLQALSYFVFILY